jgi:hypothetical protein
MRRRSITDIQTIKLNLRRWKDKIKAQEPRQKYLTECLNMIA